MRKGTWIAILSFAALTVFIVGAWQMSKVLDFAWLPIRRPLKATEVAWPPTPTFQSCWGDTRLRFKDSLLWIGPGQRRFIYDADGVFLPIANESTMVLSVLVPRGNIKAGAPAMRIGVTSLIEQKNRVMRNSVVLAQPYGNPPIQCDLNAAQAEWVRVHGIPESLIEAMRQTARDANWKPLDSNGEDIYFPSAISVPADVHFPK